MRIRIENAQCIIVMMFDEGHPASEIAEILELPSEFVRKTVIEWWRLSGDRDWEDEQRNEYGWNWEEESWTGTGIVL